MVDILTPDAKLFSGEASYVGLPGSDGSLGIMNNHAALVTTLKRVRWWCGPQVETKRSTSRAEAWRS